LWELLRELGRTEETQERPAQFHRLLEKGEQASAGLLEQLRQAEPDRSPTDACMDPVKSSCKACPKVYRQ